MKDREELHYLLCRGSEGKAGGREGRVSLAFPSTLAMRLNQS